MKQVGVRELQTERNQAVAIPEPLPGPDSALDRLAAAGRMIPARLDLAEVGLPPDQPRSIRRVETLVVEIMDLADTGVLDFLRSCQAGIAIR